MQRKNKTKPYSTLILWIYCIYLYLLIADINHKLQVYNIVNIVFVQPAMMKYIQEF